MDFDPTSEEYDLGEYTPIKPGRHFAFIEDAEYLVSKSGNDMVKVKFKIMGDDDADNTREIDHQYYVLTRKALWRYASLCRAVDPKMRKHDPTDQGELDDLFYGQPLVITTANKKETYEGNERTRTNIKDHRALNKAEEAKLTAMYGAGLVPGSPGKANDEDEDLPF